MPDSSLPLSEAEAKRTHGKTNCQGSNICGGLTRPDAGCYYLYSLLLAPNCEFKFGHIAALCNLKKPDALVQVVRLQMFHCHSKLCSRGANVRILRASAQWMQSVCCPGTPLAYWTAACAFMASNVIRKLRGRSEVCPRLFRRASRV